MASVLSLNMKDLFLLSIEEFTNKKRNKTPLILAKKRQVC
jgi:hypothetical protein